MNTQREEIETALAKVLDPSAFGEWWQTPIPALYSATPEQVLSAGDGDQLLAHVKGYLDGSFS